MVAESRVCDMPCFDVVILSVLRQFQEYVKPEDGAAAAAQARRSVHVEMATSADSDGAVAASSSLGDDTLAVNLGIPVVVVLTKVCTVACL